MPTKKGKILVVDDNRGVREALKILLAPQFAEVNAIASPKSLVSAMETLAPDAVLLDMNFHTDINSGNEGLYWTGELKKMFPGSRTVLFTAYADIALAVEGMKRGAFDFIVKPWDNAKLIATLRAACEAAPKAEKTAGADGGAQMYWGGSQAMLEIRRAVEKTAATDATVLITGENGTGKDVLARAIHAAGARRSRPMVCVDAGAIPESLFESELFGHVKGAFTDARSDHAGKFEQADKGTLFLDEIGNIPLHLQPKLLRALQERTVTRVGSEKPTPVDIRLICATNMDLEHMVDEGHFREDLFYRINTIHLRLPPLRERPGDILPLAEMFLARFAARYRRGAEAFSEEAARKLERHSWPGNIRELQNAVEKAVILSEGAVLEADDLSPGAVHAAPHAAQTLDEAEENAIRGAMQRCGGNLSRVAKELGISRPTLYGKLRKYGI